VWDPSNDGFDNDGDGAIDDEDTGSQPGDRGGPEVRVFGRIDMNYAGNSVFLALFPDNPNKRCDYMITHIGRGLHSNRQSERGQFNGTDWTYGTGPYETVGDLLRSDALETRPGSDFGGGFIWDGGVYGQNYVEPGFSTDDDDGDGIINEADERDMFFSWISNYITTRANVFEINVNVDICEPPYYPDRKLPMHAFKSQRRFARKQLLGILDRSMMLRIRDDGRCDFTGPVGVRIMRFSDDMRVY
jgi:hypothetical protein